MRSRANDFTIVVALVAGLAAVSVAAEVHKQFRYTVGPHPSVTVRNAYGPVTVRLGTGRQVLVNAVVRSDKVEVDATQSGNRVDVRTHLLQPIGAEDGQVEYEILVPADANISVHAPNGPVQVEKLRGDVVVEGDGARIDAHDLSDGHVHVSTVDGPIQLANISNGSVEVMSVGGNITLTNVSGHKVSANSNSGNISYDGDFGSNGDYSLVNHSGNIDVVLPLAASVDISARSINGTAEDDYPLQPKVHSSFAAVPGKAFWGTSSTGLSSVTLRSFSGTIRVKRR